MESERIQENLFIATRRKLMKTNHLSSLLVRNGARSSFFRKLFVSSLMVALLFTSLPAHAAFAAQASDGTSVNTKDMQQEWDNKIQKVDDNSIFYQRVRVYPADFEDSAELAAAHDILNNYGVALRSAQRIIFNHPGFDQKGKVVNENLADQSLKGLSEYLRQMRALKEKLDGLNGDYRLLPMSAITTSTAP
jgi:hypothetical protein